MAVENKVVTTNAGAVAADVDISARFIGGIKRTVPFSFEIAAADDDGSIYRFARVSPLAIPVSLKLFSDSITGFTSAKFGIYKPLEVGGAVISVDCLVAAVDINAGKSTITEMLIPSKFDQAGVGKCLGILAGIAAADLNKYGAVDVALTATTIGSAAGTIAGFFEYIEGV